MKISISKRISFLIAVTVIIVAWPILFISEEMYQEHISEVVNNTAQGLVYQTLLYMDTLPEGSEEDLNENERQYSSMSKKSGQLIIFFDQNKNIISENKSARAQDIISQLLSKFRNKDTISSFAIQTERGTENPQGWDCTLGFSKKQKLFVAICYNRDYTYDARDAVQVRTTLLISLVLLLGLLGAKWASGKTISPIKDLADYARSLPERDFSITEGNILLTKLNKVNDVEIKELVQAFAYMEDSLLEHIENKKKTAAEREKMKSELRIAAEIQQGALPKELTIPAETVSINALMQPAREVGGDLYDFFMVDEKTLQFTVGDVAGKGVPASLFMFACQHLFRSIPHHEVSLETAMTILNDNLSKDNSSAMFVSLFAGRFNIETGELEYSLAGHPPPYLKRADGTITTLEAPANLPIGSIEGIPFETRKITIQSDEILTVFTDGLFEVFDKNGELFGLQRLQNLIGTCAEGNCDEILIHILDSVNNFAKDREGQDDATILCLKRMP
ncbi:PP2C family protein-serine/threonine phosphatase [Desulfovibrio sp. JC010]|uniref:PP2C family protein-serine/threonine phosphatase n=1 Tax=Desulfovibrio sp. JC010 TaxID=2593641 RepID=UPI0013D0CF9C|nr:PP2C family protein-serine/threonine phosphatase [Desulfovibrio sp. JC010]NDV28797.1 serine/threonine-protein phosphatase [Desulfovibrio sp. JC010]